MRSKTAWINATDVATAPLWSLLNRIAPAYATTTEKVVRAMIKVAREGYAKPVLESEDINGVWVFGSEIAVAVIPTFLYSDNL